MRNKILWPSPGDLQIPESKETPDEFYRQNEYWRASLEWGISNGATEYSFLPIGTEGWVEKSETQRFPITQTEWSPERKLSFLLPPILHGDRFILWTEALGSTTPAFFQILRELQRLRRQAEEILDIEIRNYPTLTFSEAMDARFDSALLLSDSWASRNEYFTVSRDLILPEALLFGTSISQERVLRIQWKEQSGSDSLSSPVNEFISARALRKYNHVLKALGELKESKGTVLEYRPNSYFSFPFHLLVVTAIWTEAWEKLVSLWIEERPKKSEAASKLEAWIGQLPVGELESGIEALFEERTIRLIDKYTGKNDRQLLKYLESEYRIASAKLKRQKRDRLRELEETILPRQFLLREAHSKYVPSSSIERVQWEDLGKIYEENLKNLFLERNSLGKEFVSSDGKSAESWNKLIQ
ncbi:hypothetical protein LEP1GSC047_2756 [Leptospira inadai serovar Lyme str. 10]|uniref:Uncharacterized protein n=2 Tax=Leptospira inadai serovar Lyme TaxID=293084 RepID=V6HU68_9LEPT|nr:hypothetical protein [Leptospira inadai]EQA36294.1 hypothetical protein LEP1GSC047_2756 [Leptospira inadai serovar Lyme str. 10]PNV76456.1 hypothetical protein BES34_002340 [Leptospira inadai serovar Lyme]